MKVLIVDNYDSFTYNLYQYIGEILSSACNAGVISEFDVWVKRNNEITLEEIQALQPDRIIISPGPGSPDDEHYFGVCAQVIKELGPKIPLLGVCLGMQGIVHVFGGKIIKAPLPMHGKISAISHHHQDLFRNIPDQLEIMRYHSLMAEYASFPNELEITAITGDISLDELRDTSRSISAESFEIMAVKHKTYPIYGIQFHPESFATEGGKELISNFLFL
ncbi:anthranilate/aminodeoxychorismate synthase component II [Nitrincola tibetensis]|uniref:Anthranilate/aminodeoxychorismate synthase component II n=1 Tax=Nitrincola tibetensis TaxID=2219697 RepID=A0A364NQ22_9GAMM|nr:aminodeoxychorismate/anthranilate synthase component II [Nitrincola tibetensis]RAU18985.1 anthranilate/aminodeoxychorismate synthase component II [Nitrincola tibetensis]